MKRPTQLFRLGCAAVAATLALTGCASQPKAPHVLEFALVADGGPGAFDADYTPRGGTPTQLSLEPPQRFAVARADLTQDPSTGDPAVTVDFEPAAGVQFESWTGKNLERRLAVLLDGQVMLVATIQSPLSGKMMFLRASPPFTTAEARDVVDGLNADH